MMEAAFEKDTEEIEVVDGEFADPPEDFPMVAVLTKGGFSDVLHTGVVAIIEIDLDRILIGGESEVPPEIEAWFEVFPELEDEIETTLELHDRGFTNWPEGSIDIGGVG